jgi:hypothetical protein
MPNPINAMNNFEIYHDNPITNRRERLIDGEIVESMSIQLLYDRSSREFIKQHMGKMWINPWMPGVGRCP